MKFAVFVDYAGMDEGTANRRSEGVEMEPLNRETFLGTDKSECE